MFGRSTGHSLVLVFILVLRLVVDYKVVRINGIFISICILRILVLGNCGR